MKYWQERGNLSVNEGLLMRGQQLVVPPNLRIYILRYHHDCPQVITKTREKVASSVWWPGISRDIEKMVKNCAICEQYRKDRIEPMKGTEFPHRPRSSVGVDFFTHKGHTYLLTVDYYSRDVEICIVSTNVNTGETLSKLKKSVQSSGNTGYSLFGQWATFDSEEFKDFSKSWGFEHVTSSPKYP